MVFHPPAPAEARERRAPPKPSDRPTEPLETAQRLIPLAQALSSYNQNLLPLPVESIATDQALNRCLAESPVARIDLPSFTQSAVDGYALLSFETTWATPAKPLRLQVIGEIAAGPRKADPPPLAGNMAYRILTGAPIPRGVDTVVPQERVERGDGIIRLIAPVPEKQNIRYHGEELKRGDALAAAGQRISPGMLAALMMAGAHGIRVYRRPRVSVLVTGNEVVPAGQLPVEGQVHDANAPLIRSWMMSQGYPAPEIAYAKDVRGEVEAALKLALDNSDLVITTGGGHPCTSRA